MTIQELFRKADPELVFHAYTLIRAFFDDLDTHTMQEQAVILRNFRTYIGEVCAQIATCDIEREERSQTLFVIGRTSLKWEESHIQDLECFTIYDDEAKKAVECNFTMWNDDGDMRLEHYGIDFVKIPALAGYHIAKSSVEEQGIDVCCAVILEELFSWGLTEEQREERYEELVKRIKKSEQEVEAGHVVTSEELWEELDKEFLEHASEDEKQHMYFEREYEKNVEEIEQRHREEISAKDHQRFIDIVKKEYKRGVCL